MSADPQLLVSGAAALPRRRDLRPAPPEPSARVARVRRGGVLAEPAPSARPRHQRGRVVVVPQPTGARRGLCAALAVLVVPCLFATAALPAYASTFSGDPATAAALTAGPAFVVSASAAAASIDRGGISATSDAEMARRLADPARAARVAAYDASGARELGDDYPWPYEANDDEGGGLSPLGYYYRECVDFVAWRLDVDAGSASAPYKWTWSNLTPNGGDASDWPSAWQAHGWPTGSQPEAGSVAWFSPNHVAYVRDVLDDGNVVIEEYNHGMTHKYGVRTLPASSVPLFLYAPPA